VILRPFRMIGGKLVGLRTFSVWLPSFCAKRDTLSYVTSGEGLGSEAEGVSGMCGLPLLEKM
jgi:hypothetical protein